MINKEKSRYKRYELTTIVYTKMTALMFLFRNCKQSFVAIGLLVLIVACSSEKKPNEDLQQAFKLHNEAIDIRDQLDDQLATLVENSDSLFLHTNIKDLDSINSSLKDWDEQLVEVPGFEEEHDHASHEHHHHHDEQPELTPAQHLQVQQHLLQEIRAIDKRIDQLKEQQ